jgi:hypothetical protein
LCQSHTRQQLNRLPLLLVLKPQWLLLEVLLLLCQLLLLLLCQVALARWCSCGGCSCKAAVVQQRQPTWPP